MNRFLVRLIVYSFLIFLVHMAIGAYLKNIAKENETEHSGYHPRQRWADFHELSPNTIDLLFLGSSHCYRSFNPSIVDSLTNKKSFNLGSSIQTPITSFFVLKEALQTQNPKLLVLEIYFRTFYDASNRQYQSANFNFEFMKSNTVKVDFLINSYGKDIPKVLLPTYSQKRGFDYLIEGYKLQNTKEEYLNKGFVERTDTLSSTRHYNVEPYKFDFDETNKKQSVYLEKIIRLCKDNSIELILVTAPITKEMKSTILNYEDVYQHFNRVAQENDLDFIDYNKIDVNLIDTVHFYDFQHLNKAGSEIISRNLSYRIANKKLF